MSNNRIPLLSNNENITNENQERKLDQLRALRMAGKSPQEREYQQTINQIKADTTLSPKEKKEKFGAAYERLIGFPFLPNGPKPQSTVSIMEGIVKASQENSIVGRRYSARRVAEQIEASKADIRARKGKLSKGDVLLHGAAHLANFGHGMASYIPGV